MRRLFLLLLVIQTLMLVVGGSSAFAFPELTRFGYNNCTACHVSPSGGGLLTAYGRSLSSEVLSTWGSEKTAGVFWSAIDREPLENWLLLGGDARAVQVRTEDSARKVAKFIKMQADISAGWVRDQYGAVITMGDYQDPKWNPYFTSGYAFWRPRDEFTLRAGRFLPAYGLHMADHIAFVRQNLGFGLNSMRDSVETQWTSELYTLNYTHSKQFKTDDPEVANSVQAQVYLFEKWKLAANYWSGRTHTSKRDISGLWSVVGFTKRLYLNSEVDLQSQTESGSTQRLFVSYNKLGFTVFKGFDLLLLSEHLHTNLDLHATITNRNGPGFQFYPLPHIEVAGAWTKQQSTAPGAREQDYAWLLLHYYL